eukprot:8736881-Ditylum_brightwellii.AAC.1
MDTTKEKCHPHNTPPLTPTTTTYEKEKQQQSTVREEKLEVINEEECPEVMDDDNLYSDIESITLDDEGWENHWELGPNTNTKTQ